MAKASAAIADSMSKTFEPKTPLAARVAMARAKTGLNQREASKAAGLAPGHVGTIERGETATMNSETAQGLAKVFGVSWQWLMAGDGDAPAPASAASVVTSEAERYPNRLVAAKLVRGKVDAETVDALLSMRLDSDRDLTVAEWVAEARTLQEIRAGIAVAEAAEIDDAPSLLPRKR